MQFGQRQRSGMAGRLYLGCFGGIQAAGPAPTLRHPREDSPRQPPEPAAHLLLVSQPRHQAWPSQRDPRRAVFLRHGGKKLRESRGRGATISVSLWPDAFCLLSLGTVWLLHQGMLSLRASPQQTSRVQEPALGTARPCTALDVLCSVKDNGCRARVNKRAQPRCTLERRRTGAILSALRSSPSCQPRFRRPTQAPR